MKFWDKLTHCSDDGKIALGCALCNFIAVLATTREIYPKFHSFPCYYIYLLTSTSVVKDIEEWRMTYYPGQTVFNKIDGQKTIEFLNMYSCVCELPNVSSHSNLYVNMYSRLG